MVITDGFVVCQDNGDWTSPICVHSTLSDAVEWLIRFWTLDDGSVSSKYRPENYKIEKWQGGARLRWNEWRVRPDGRAVVNDV